MALLPYVVAIPLGAAFLILLVGRRFKASSGVIAVSAVFCVTTLSLRIASMVATGKILCFKMGNWQPPFGIPLVADGLSALMLVIASVVGLLVTIYSVGYIRVYTDRWKYYALMMLMIAGINGVLLTGDIFNLFVCLEIASIATYALVAYGLEDESLEASFKYAVMSSVGSCFILLGIAFLYSFTSTLNMADMASTLVSHRTDKVVYFVSALFMMGFGLKAALVPFHAWLPYAHSASPSPVSAMLSGVSIKVLGIYAIARIFYNVIGITPAVQSVIITFAVLSMITGAVLAFGQKDIKRVFAYSSISQIGFIALGLGISTPLGLTGAIFYLLNHSLFKSLLFLGAGSMERITGTRDLSKMRNVIESSPLTGYATLIGALSISGIPPFGGFWGKLLIIFSCLQAGRPVLAIVAVGVSALTIAYYFKALVPALFGNDAAFRVAGIGGKRITFAMAAPMAVLAVLTAVAGLILLPGTANTLLKGSVAVLSSGIGYAESIFGAIR